jgi:hypothetical protein
MKTLITAMLMISAFPSYAAVDEIIQPAPVAPCKNCLDCCPIGAMGCLYGVGQQQPRPQPKLCMSYEPCWQIVHGNGWF